MKVVENFEEIKGLYYIENYLTKDESKEFEHYIVTNTNLEPISTAKSSRRVAHFGYYYSYNHTGLKPAPPIPEWLDQLMDYTLPMLNVKFDQIIINEYTPGQQIAYHTDHVKLFGPMIACITVGKSIPIQFQKDGIVKTLNIESGSMYIMTDEARYQWQHSLKNNSKETRYSITYRTVINTM